MQYHLVKYFAVFLPIVLLVYQLVPKKFRWLALLAANYTFFCMISGQLVIYLLCATLIAHYAGIWIENITLTAQGTSHEIMKRKRYVLAFGTLISLAILITLKYFNFFGQSISDFLHIFKSQWNFKPIDFLVPVGISYYTLQVISYITDVYRGTTKPDRNIGRLALYLSFFPQVMEGPISRYHEVADSLYSGEGLKFDNLKFGYQRIVWGLFKKIVIADRLGAVASNVFKFHGSYDGACVAFGVICYTFQLYMEFSGCMDIIIGSGELFGVKLPENFRQPFFAKDASDFWHRWHITLGTWFKDYIFYPVSLAKPVKNLAKKVKKKFGRNVGKFVAPIIALFCVWSCNGLWHGASWTYIFYGMYYFVLIVIENLFEEPVVKLTAKLHINRDSKGYRVFRMLKLFIIINLGEMFFRAPTVKQGFAMLGQIVTDFHITKLLKNMDGLGMDWNDLAVVGVGLIIVLIVGIIREKGINIREKIAGWKLPLRWVFWYAVIMCVVIFGAYGVGYSAIDMIYAGY